MNLVGLKTAFKSGSTVNVHKYVVGFNPEGFVNGLTDSGDLALDEMINERVRIYEAQIGYPTSIESSDVKDVIKKSLMAFSALLQIKKWADAQNLVMGNGQKLNITGAIVPVGGLISASQFLDITQEGPSGENWRNLVLPAISNTVWANLVGNLKEVAILPPALANLSSYLISNFFSNHYNDDDGVSQLIEFIPNNIFTDTAQFLDLFNTNIEDIRDLYNASPGLYAFMLQFIPTIELHEDDFRRDLSGRTITIIDDAKLLQSFDTNATMYTSVGKDSMLTYGEENVVASIFDSTPTQLMDITTVFYDLIFKAVGSSVNFIITAMNYVRNNTGVYLWAIPEGRISNISSVATASELNIAFRGMDRYPFDCVYTALYSYSTTSSRLTTTMPDADLKSGFNLYTVNGDDSNQIRDTWFKHALFSSELPGSVNRVDNEGLTNDSEKPKKRRNTKRKPSK